MSVGITEGIHKSVARGPLEGILKALTNGII